MRHCIHFFKDLHIPWGCMLLQSTLNNLKLLNWNFWLTKSDVMVLAIWHAIQWQKLPDNSKLKRIVSVNWKLSRIKNIDLTFISWSNWKFSRAKTAVCSVLMLGPLLLRQHAVDEAGGQLRLSPALAFEVLNLPWCAQRHMSSLCGGSFRLQFQW